MHVPSVVLRTEVPTVSAVGATRAVRGISQIQAAISPTVVADSHSDGDRRLNNELPDENMASIAWTDRPFLLWPRMNQACWARASEMLAANDDLKTKARASE